MAIERINIEWKEIGDFPHGAGHLYLVARESGQSNGDGYAISGYPEGSSDDPENPEFYGTQRLEVNKGFSEGAFVSRNSGYGATLSETHDIYKAGDNETNRGTNNITLGPRLI